ncbi:MAG: hypothetical protein Q4B14_02785 [Clostridia bacterium]|nr:hypothetical protein [Clostridia bacterium]
MENKELKAFNIITDMVYETLSKDSFTKKSVVNDDNELSIILQSQAIAYKIIFEKEKNLYSLSNCVVAQNSNNEDVYENWKTLVEWLFDPGVNTTRDAEDIGKDFSRTLSGSKQKKLVKTTKKKKADEPNAGTAFFFNRLVNVFPELKNDIIFERNNYEDFRSVTFTKEKVLPKVAEVLTRGENARIKKLCSILSNMYDSGDLDVRGLITYVILNSITDAEQKNIVNDLLSDDLKKAWGFSQKLIGKNIKPEKIKVKKNNFMSATLNS